MLKREILDLVHDLPCSLEQDVFPALVERGEIRGREFDGYFLDIGLPETLEQGHRELPSVRVRPAAFLDRNALVDFAGGDSFGRRRFNGRAGAVEAIRTLNDRGYYVFVVSDRQARETRDARAPLNAAMQERLAPEGAHVDRFYAAVMRFDDVTRKPVPSRLFEAMNEWPIVRERSFFIGASGDDVEAARSAGFEAMSLTEAISRASSVRSWRRLAED